jgi:hypothetical protein
VEFVTLGGEAPRQLGVALELLRLGLLTFHMQLHKRTELSMWHFTESILQVSYLYFPKRGMISIISKTNTGGNSNAYY